MASSNRGTGDFPQLQDISRDGPQSPGTSLTSGVRRDTLLPLNLPDHINIASECGY